MLMVFALTPNSLYKRNTVLKISVFFADLCPLTDNRDYCNEIYRPSNRSKIIDAADRTER